MRQASQWQQAGAAAAQSSGLLSSLRKQVPLTGKAHNFEADLIKVGFRCLCLCLLGEVAQCDFGVFVLPLQPKDVLNLLCGVEQKAATC